MTLRPATAADVADVAAIQSASPEAARWNPADYLNYDCQIAIVDDAVAGFLATRQTAAGECEILNLAIAPNHRRRGIARALLEEELAHSRGAWYLEVRESNTAAIALYTSAGFEIVGRRPRYYNDPPETGVVMRFLS